MALQPDFPFVSGGPRGYFKISDEDATIPGRIAQLLQTRPGERRFLCAFGVGLQDYLFEPLDDLSLNQIYSRIMEQMARWEPGLAVELLNIEVEDYGPPATIRVTITVRSRKTNRRKTMRFPIGA